MAVADPERSPPARWPGAPARPALACAWCGATFDSRSKALAGRRECASCGAATTDPQPTDEQLELAYSTWYRPDSGRFAGPGDRVLSLSRGLLARRLDRIAPPGPILDVGSGDGSLLRALRARGRHATGLERGADAPGVREADVRELDERFAAIVFWHSLEHLRDAGAVLDHAAGLLAPGGVIVIAMPNPASMQARTFGDRWLALDLPRHLVHVPAGALRARLEADGVPVARYSGWRGGQVLFGWLHAMVATLPGRLDLYAALRQEQARGAAVSGPRRLAAIAAAVLLSPAAVAATLAELAAGRSGTTYVEARRR
jgi:SAM-dependent methyltransferase